MRSKLIHNYYFSGTGNTKSLVQHFSEQLEALGYQSVVRRMDRDHFIETEEDFALGLMFPVAIQSTYPIVWDFVSNLPPGNEREVFMFDTLEAFSGGVVGPMKKILTEKGYRCIGAKEFKMSSSLNSKPGKVEKGSEKNAEALKQVGLFAKDLISGKTQWCRIPVLSDMMRSISVPDKLWIKHSHKLSVTDNCINCLICEINCPVGAINHNERKVFIDDTLCISCMRCAAGCPRKAILIGGKELLLSCNNFKR